ncbi:MAG: exodeoxyribonuclease VII large subunit [Polyangiaceae bacterium]
MNDEQEAIIAVSELARRMKHALSRSVGRVWIEGEIAHLKRSQNGHVYFSLKDVDEGAVVESVMYRMNAARAWRYLQDGARVQVQGKPDLWIPRGRLQFVVDRLRPAGRGSQLEALERLKLKLAAEGLFADERKRPLPSSPRVVGVITSEHGAAIHDIITVAFRRGGAHIVLSPAQVQGEQAVRSLLYAIDLVERHPRLDVLIIGRGGGSGEDLMAFNDERLVRRLAAVRVPIVSAVGHEVDLSLTDLVADIRAATPSQAAELVVADRVTQKRELRDAERHLLQAVRHRLKDDQQVLDRLERRLGDPLRMLGERAQEVDELSERLEAHITQRLKRQRVTFTALERRLLLRDPKAVLARTRLKLAPLEAQLQSSMLTRLQRERQKHSEFKRSLVERTQQALEARRDQLSLRATQLDGLSPLRILGRGYAIAAKGERIIKRADELRPGDELQVRLGVGSVRSTVSEITRGEEPEA